MIHMHTYARTHTHTRPQCHDAVHTHRHSVGLLKFMLKHLYFNSSTVFLTCWNTKLVTPQTDRNMLKLPELLTVNIDMIDPVVFGTGSTDQSVSIVNL